MDLMHARRDEDIFQQTKANGNRHMSKVGAQCIEEKSKEINTENIDGRYFSSKEKNKESYKETLGENISRSSD